MEGYIFFYSQAGMGWNGEAVLFSATKMGDPYWECYTIDKLGSYSG